MTEEHLKTLVEFYPVSSDQDAVGRLLAYVKAYCEKAGLKAELLQYDGVNNLYVTHGGQKHVKLLLQAHVDVVPGAGQPFKATKDKLEGRGVYDMLFGAACYMRLIDELVLQIEQYDFGIMLSGDEELGGDKGVEAFLNAGYGCDVCILPDAGNGYGTLSVGAKGIYEIIVRVHGKAHHGSRPWEGDGAAAKLMHFLAEAEQIFDASSRDNSTMTVATLSAGDVLNRGPAYADAGLDIRFKDEVDLSRIKKEMQTLFEKYDAKIVSTEYGDCFTLDTHNPYITKFLDLYTKQVGKEIRSLVAPGSSDARFFTKYQVPVIMFRPDGGGAHGDYEWISRKSLEAFYGLLKTYVTSVSKV